MTSGRQTISLAEIELDEGRRKIDQYLDATRSELLFARRVMLVEGISEAVLMPALARHCVFPSMEEGHVTGRKAFQGISIIPIGSVDFAPYVRLLLQPVDGIRVAERLVVVTDGDPITTDEDADDASGQYNRAATLQSLGVDLGANDACFHVASGTYTLEADLLIPGGGNLDVVKEAITKQRPQFGRRHWEEIVRAESPAAKFYEKLHKNSRLVSKGQLAHDLVELISDGASFACPVYLATAMEWIVES